MIIEESYILRIKYIIVLNYKQPLLFPSQLSAEGPRLQSQLEHEQRSIIRAQHMYVSMYYHGIVYAICNYLDDYCSFRHTAAAYV